MTNTIANQLNGKRVEREHYCNAVQDKATLIYTFKDGSRAKIITKYEDCEPYLAPTLTTMTKKAYGEWKEV